MQVLQMKKKAGAQRLQRVFCNRIFSFDEQASGFYANKFAFVGVATDIEMNVFFQSRHHKGKYVFSERRIEKTVKAKVAAVKKNSFCCIG